MLELALKARGVEIYTISTLENNYYLLDDLLPDLIVFDVETTGNQIEELLKYSSRAILVAVGSEAERSKFEGIVENYLTKPFEAKKIADQIISILYSKS
jgi:DNA-binding response OmpR family regulator